MLHAGRFRKKAALLADLKRYAADKFFDSDRVATLMRRPEFKLESLPEEVRRRAPRRFGSWQKQI
jgi:hypothetical protein